MRVTPQPLRARPGARGVHGGVFRRIYRVGGVTLYDVCDEDINQENRSIKIYVTFSTYFLIFLLKYIQS